MLPSSVEADDMRASDGLATIDEIVPPISTSAAGCAHRLASHTEQRSAMGRVRRNEPSAVKTVLFHLLIAAALSACQATHYQPSAAAGGFGDVELDGNIWRIRFTHNAFTTRETAQSYWLYRAAELTLSKGYAGFEVLSQASRTRSFGDGLSRHSTFVFEGEIRMLKEPFESTPPKIFDAAALRAVLDPYVSGATKGPVPASPAAQRQVSGPDGLRLQMIYSMPCIGSGAGSGQADCSRSTPAPAPKPAARAVDNPAPAPIPARPQLPGGS